MKPMLATDLDHKKLVFPLGAQPKIDGVRGMTPDGRMQGRSGKAFGNRYTVDFFSQDEYAWLDGELAAEHECNPNLCRITSSATATHEGTPYLLWHVFDMLHQDVCGKPYIDRYNALAAYVKALQSHGMGMNLRVVPMVIVNNLEEFLALEEKWLAMGYEGIIARRLDAPHKQGRSTVREGGLLRGKRFLDFECVVNSIVEGQHNANEATESPHGYVERSTHQENMVPNGMVGVMVCTVLKDVVDPSTKLIVLRQGETVNVAPGCMTHDMRKHYFENPNELINDVIKGKFFPKGIKDKPRFANYQSHRSAADM